MSAAPSEPAGVYQQSFSIERQWVKEVVRAILGAVLFHRSLGNLRPSSFECAGVTFPIPAEPETDALLSAKVEAFARALHEQSSSAEPKSSRLVVAVYPTPVAPRQLSPPAPKPRPIAPTVTSALGWFSASAKALATGVMEEPPPQEEEDLGPPWEAWVLDFEVVPEGRRGVSEEKLRHQLNQFLLRSLEFVMNRTTQVPPITTADLQPFGLQILIDPPSLHFSVPKAVVSPSSVFPLLEPQLTSPSRTAPTVDGRREGYAAFGR